jgi:sulfur carrier protein ThiS
MGTALTAKECIQFKLLRPDFGQQTFRVAEGATLADLLRAAGTEINSPNILIDGSPVDDALKLKSGMIVTIVRRAARAPRSGSWRNSVGTVHDTPAFREMIAEGRAIREADPDASSDRIDQDDA